MDAGKQTTHRRNRPRKRPGKPDKPVQVRCFAGIRFDRLEMLQGLLAELDQLVDDPASGLRIVPPANLHITLKFLGSVDEPQLSAIDLALKEVATGHGPLQLDYAGVGVFKNSIWVGVVANESLTRLATAIDLACAELGFRREDKAYVPHITLARFDREGKIKLSALQEKFADRRWGEGRINAMQLYKSETLPQGAKYSVLSQYQLQGD